MPPRRAKVSCEAPPSDDETEETVEEAPEAEPEKPPSKFVQKYRSDPAFAEAVRERARKNGQKRKEERASLKAVIAPKLGAGQPDVSAMLFLMAKIDDSERKRRKLKKEIRATFGSIAQAVEAEKESTPPIPTEPLRAAAPIRVQADEARPVSPYSPRSDSEVTAPSLRIMRRADTRRR